MERFSGSTSGRKRPWPTPWPTPIMLNDHIYELYKPTEVPSMDILFFHGLQFEDSCEAYWSTWTCGNAPEQIWPSTWLADKFPYAHIFSVSYDSSLRTTQEERVFDLHIVAENLIQVIYSTDIGQHDRPMILVGHCFGGLVIKNLCVEAYQTHCLGSQDSERTQNIERFLRNMRGIFFYGTPHHGSHLLEEAGYSLGSPFMPYVEVLSKESARLEATFDALCKKYEKLHIASVGESLPMSSGPFTGRLVVPEASARYGEYSTAPAVDHIALCRPASQTSMSFQRLERLLRSIEPEVQVDFHFHNMQQVPNPLIGLDIPIKNVEEILLKNQKVGIVGMGGIGKTTLAMALFNKLGPKFEYNCFIPMVKKIEGSVEDVEREVWNRLHLHCRGKKDNYKKGCWSTMIGKRLLLVLDDMSNRDIDVLSNIANTTGIIESRFIMTSRDGDLFNKKGYIIYHIPLLDYPKAKELFMTYACPEESLESSVRPIVEKCDGLPLTLEVLGSYLHGETNVEVWEQALEDLNEANAISDQERRLWAQLSLSYNDLEEAEQQMFLDATTFFSGTTWTLREAKGAWRAIYGSEHRRWRILLKKSLVYEVDEDDPIRVHEQLQSLGKKLASKCNKCRTGDFTKALEVLQSTDVLDHQGCGWQPVHALRLESDDWQKSDRTVFMSRSGFLRLKTVEYLDLKVPVRLSIEDALESKAFPSYPLVLLGCLGHQFCQLFKPALLARLMVLKISSPGENGIEYLPKSIGQLSALKILNISDAFNLESLPYEIGRLSKLECLKVLGCPSLHKLPESFGQLCNLKQLEFSDCHLETLPESFGQLSKLEHLQIRDCESLASLPESFEQLRALKHLKLHSCFLLYTLPDSFGHLAMLETLDFLNCYGLHYLPESFGHLFTLKHLKFHWCTSLKSLPESFKLLSALEFLEFLHCVKLNDLPEFFGQMGKLQRLIIYNCCMIERIPNSFADLKALRQLILAYIDLTSIPDSIETLPSLQTLEIGVLPNLKGFPPWLGSTALASPAKFARKIFHVQDGRFSLAKEQKIATDDNWILVDWLERLKTKVTDKLRTSDTGVLVALESWRDLHEKLGDLSTAKLGDWIRILQTEGMSTAELGEWIRILQQEGTSKGLRGDLHGALEYLDTAIKCLDIQRCEDRGSLEYVCRKERDYIRCLMDDTKGAREDGEAAFKHQSRIITDETYGTNFLDHEIQSKITLMEDEFLRNDLDWANFDDRLKQRTENVLDSLEQGFKSGGLKISSLKDVTNGLMEMEKDVLEFIRSFDIDIWENDEMRDLVTQYPWFSLDFCGVLQNSVQHMRDNQMIIEYAMGYMPDSREPNENECRKILQELDLFVHAEDPFSTQFTKFYDRVYGWQRHIEARLNNNMDLPRSRRERHFRAVKKVTTVILTATYASSLICAAVAMAVTAPLIPCRSIFAAAVPGFEDSHGWLRSLWSKYEQRMEKEVIVEPRLRTYIAINDLDTINSLVKSLMTEIKSIVHKIEFAHVRGDSIAVQLSVKMFKNKQESFLQQLDDLNSLASDCIREINIARTLVSDIILGHSARE